MASNETNDHIAGANRVRKQERLTRAGRACLSCRARKVRCNVVESNPCSNCKWDHVQCIIPRTRRSRKILFDSLDASADTDAPRTVYCDVQPGRGGGASSISRRPSAGLSASPVSSSGTNAEDMGFSLTTTFARLPSFIKRPTTDNAAKAAFLESQGAFTLPPVPVQFALLKAYIEFAYPRMPVLNLNEICDVLQSLDGSPSQISLLLYVAILFAGSAHTRPDILAKGGQADKRGLRKDLLRRAELLFEFDTESDRVVLIQAALLLTTQGVSQRVRKDSWHWLNTATALASSIDLQRDPSFRGIGGTKAKVLRRLWWCVYLRDKVLALATNRPPRVRSEDCSLSMLQMADMELDLLTTKHVLLGHDTVGPYDAFGQTESAELCIEKTKLSVLIDRVLRPRRGQLFDTAGILATQAVEDVDTIDLALRTWLMNLPDSCRCQPLAETYRPDAVAASNYVRRRLLQMVYYTAIYTLHCPRSLPDLLYQRSSLPPHTRDEARSLVLDSADKITYMAADLHHNDLASDLPISTITVLSPAIAVSILNMKKGADRAARDAAASSFRVCMRIVEKLRDLYPTTDMTIGYLDVVLRNALSSHPSVTARLMPSSIVDVFEFNRRDDTDLAMVLSRGSSSFAVNPTTLLSSFTADLGLFGEGGETARDDGDVSALTGLDFLDVALPTNTSDLSPGAFLNLDFNVDLDFDLGNWVGEFNVL